MTRRTLAVLLPVVALSPLLGLSGCGSSRPDGPPELRLGRDQCAECGMIINEDRCSTAFIFEDAKGSEVALFDDLGCMLDHERMNQEKHVTRRYVHDYNTKAWLEASGATYLWAESVRTPMGTGLVAFSTKDAAEAMKKEHPGELYDYPLLAAARKKWMEERFGTPK